MQAINRDIVHANMEVEGAQKNLSDAKDKISGSHKIFESWNNKFPNKTKDDLISH